MAVLPPCDRLGMLLIDVEHRDAGRLSGAYADQRARPMLPEPCDLAGIRAGVVEAMQRAVFARAGRPLVLATWEHRVAAVAGDVLRKLADLAMRVVLGPS